MKRSLALIATLAMIVLSGCYPTRIYDQPVQYVSNKSPVIELGAIHSPNGEQQHAPYQWDIWGTGYDPDGVIVEWIIRVDGHTFRVGPGELDRSKLITYQFAGPGWYPLSVTGIDDDGAATEYETPPDGLWHVRH